MMKKVLSLILCAAMLFAMVPAVFASGDTVVSISAQYTEQLIENTDGCKTADSLGREYFMYNVYDDGLMLTVTYDNGETETQPYYEFYDVEVSSNQGYANQWGVGEHSVTVRYAGKKTTATLTIVESPVERIEAVMMRPLVFGVDGYTDLDYTDDGDVLPYFRFYLEYDLYITVYYKDGECFEGYAYDLYDSADRYYRLDIYDDQSYENQWGAGTHTATVSFMGAECTIEVEIVESDVVSIEAVSNKDFIEFVDCIILPAHDWETGEITGYYPYYDIRDGLEITITYKNGEKCTYSYEELRESEGSSVLIYDDQLQQDEYWSVGKHTVLGSYMGVDFVFEVNIVPNPYSSVSVYEGENKELHIVFTSDSGSMDCKAEGLSIKTSGIYGYIDDAAVSAVIRTDKGSFDVILKSGDISEEGLKICYGKLESNTLAECDWLSAASVALGSVFNTTMYSYLSLIMDKDEFYGYNAEDPESSIDYIAAVSAAVYIVENMDAESIEDLIFVDEETGILCIKAGVGEIAAAADKTFGVDCDFSVLDGYDAETGMLTLPYIGSALLYSDFDIEDFYEKGIDSCVYENGAWTASAHYLDFDGSGDFEERQMTFTVSDGMKLISVDMGKNSILGDVTGDGVVNMKDSNMMKRIILGSHTPSQKQFDSADINGDGSINTKDAYLLKQLMLEG